MNEFKDIKNLSEQVIKAATEVHQIIGPGMLESVYQDCLSHELKLREIPFEQQKELTIEYKDATIDGGHRLDFVVADKINMAFKIEKSKKSLADFEKLRHESNFKIIKLKKK